MIRKVLKKIICAILPELKVVLYKDVAFDWIVNTKINVDFDEFTKTYAPYAFTNVSLGKGSYVSSNAKISNTSIGKFCSIGPNLVCGWGIHPLNGISTNPFFYSTKKQNGATLASSDLIDERKPIIIGNDVFIGANVTILDGVVIGDGAVIGAGAVVSKSIPAYAVAVGSPIEIKKYRFEKIKIEELLKIQWWNFDDSKLNEINKLFFDVEEFIEKYN